MGRRSPLDAVLLVRRAQEERAGSEVARARAEAAEAAGAVARHEDRLESPVTVTGSAAWAGVMAARASLAAEAVAARALLVRAEAVAAADLDTWAAARAARRGVERLAERRAEADRAAAARRDQHAMDDRAGAEHHRRRDMP